MTEDNIFKDQKKLRKAKIINPPNVIKGKIGSGGLDPAVIARAERTLENNAADFKPIALELIKELDGAIESAKSNTLQGEAPIEAMLYPAAQFKTLGAMYHYPLITDISEILVNFLETVTTPLAEDSAEIIIAHKQAIAAIINNNITAADHAQGVELKKTLSEACVRYYKKRQA